MSNTLSQTPFFTPNQISGCSLWLDAADPTKLTLSGNNVTQWNDKSSNALVLTQGASAPTLGPLLNNLQTIQFTTTQSLGSTTNLLTNPAQTWFTVFNAYNNTNTNRFFLNHSSNIVVTGGEYFFGGNGVLWNNIKSGNLSLQRGIIDNTGLGVSPFNSGQWYITDIVDSNTTTDINSYNFNINGTSRAISIHAGYSNILTGTANINVFINNGASANVYISEVIFYNTALSISQIQQVEGYLAWKWGLVSNLPSNHPYKNTSINSITTLPPQFRNIGTIPLAPSSTPFVFGFNPVRIGSCSIWYDGADPNGNGVPPANGSSQAIWVDKSGNGKNTSSSSAPTFSASSLNGLGTLRFNGASGTGYFLTLPSFEFGSSQRTVFFVMANTGPSSGAGSEPIIFWPLTGNGTNSLSFDSWFRANVQGQAYGATATFVKNQYYVISYRFGSTTAYEEIYGNGSLAATNTKTNGGSSYANASSGYSLGWIQGDTNTNYALDGNIGEMLIYSTALSDSQRQQVEGYLAWKWGLVANLPSNHPFKNSPPGLSIPVVPQTRQLGNRVFQPTSFSGCQLWLDGADASTLVLSGTNVTQWNDKSGNVNNATGFNNPTYNNNSVTLNGTNQYLTCPNVSYRPPNIFVVATNNSSGEGTIIRKGQSSPVTFEFTIAPLTATTVRYELVTSTPTVIAASPNTVASTSGRQLYEMTYNNATLIGYLNGTVVGTASGVGPTFSGTSKLFLGVIPDNNNNPWTAYLNGSLQEVIIYTSTPTTNQRQTVEGYLAWKWGLQGNLPANHPYKKWPPPP